MKLKIISVLVAAVTMAASNATTITASGGTTGAQFVTSLGTFLTPTNSTVIVGSMSGDLFTAFAVSDAAPITFGTTASLEGRWLGNASDTSVAATPFNGLQVWFQITTTADGGGVAYLSGGQLFPNNNAGVGDALAIPGNSLNTFNANLSTPGTEVFAAADGTYPNGHVTIGVIPEPSAAFIGAIGALGLLRRRRN